MFIKEIWLTNLYCLVVGLIIKAIFDIEHDFQFVYSILILKSENRFLCVYVFVLISFYYNNKTIVPFWFPLSLTLKHNTNPNTKP